MQSMKSHRHGISLLRQSIIMNIQFNYIKRLFFYYLRYPHDIRMKYCGFGCQNSCGYPRVRIRSSDTPLVFIKINKNKQNTPNKLFHMEILVFISKFSF